MFFRHAALLNLSATTITEHWQSMPQDCFPALIGSGKLGVAVDATGLQGLGSRIRQYRDTFSNTDQPALVADQLYLYRHDAISDHLRLGDHGAPYDGTESRDDAETRGMGLMPCGYLSYELTIDGHHYGPEEIAVQAHDWRREFDPHQGTLVTSYVLATTRVFCHIGAALDAESLRLIFRIESADGTDRSVDLMVLVHHTLRDGSNLAADISAATVVPARGIVRTWRVSNETATARVLRPFDLTSAILSSAETEAVEKSEFIALQWSGRTGVETAWTVVCGESAVLDAEVRALSGAQVGRHLQVVVDSWQRFFSDTAEIETGDPTKDHLDRMARYTLRAGGSWRTGLPLGTLWNRSFGGSTFWDSFFAADGMLRHGHLGPVRAFADWLVDTISVAGRPHYWMTFFDGTPVEQADQAYQVCLAYGQIVIRLCEYSRSEIDIRDRGLPYLQALATYLLDEIVEPHVNAEGQETWRLCGRVAGDVDARAVPAETEAGMMLWVVSCLSKYAEYADRFGLSGSIVERCRRIDHEFRINPIDMSDPGMWGLWYSYLTGEGPHMNHDSWKVFARSFVEDLGFARYEMSPWMLHCEAMGLLDAGYCEAASELLDNALKPVIGLGYHYETPYELRSGGLAPYIPASGSFLSATASIFADGDLWGNHVFVATRLPKLWRSRRLRWRNIHTAGGVRVGGRYEPSEAHYEIACAQTITVTARVPARIVGSPLLCTVDGIAIRPQLDAELAVFVLEAGDHSITIARDDTLQTDVTLVESLDHGGQVAEILRSNGLTVRWHRDVELGAAAQGCRVMVVHESYVALPPEVVHQLRGAVEGGLQLVTIFHSGFRDHDRLMAELTGVYADRLGPMFNMRSSLRDYVLTECGTSKLTSLCRTFAVPATDRFRPHPGEDVTILAIEEPGRTPVVTYRPCGKGGVWWIAAGNRFMDHFKNQWGDIHTQMMTWGTDPSDEWPDRKWIRNAAWRNLLSSVVDAALRSSEAP